MVTSCDVVVLCVCLCASVYGCLLMRGAVLFYLLGCRGLKIWVYVPVFCCACGIIQWSVLYSGSSTTSRSSIVQQPPTTLPPNPVNPSQPPVNPPHPPVIRTTTPPLPMTTTATAPGNIPNKEPDVQTPCPPVFMVTSGDGLIPNPSGNDPQTSTPSIDGANRGEDMQTPSEEDIGNSSSSFVRRLMFSFPIRTNLPSDVTNTILFQILTSWRWVLWEAFWLYSFLEWLLLLLLCVVARDSNYENRRYIFTTFPHCTLFAIPPINSKKSFETTAITNDNIILAISSAQVKQYLTSLFIVGHKTARSRNKLS